jgi:hypothetical protein
MLDSEIIDLMDCLSTIGQAQTPLDKRLEIYKEIESVHPGCHIGGSIGLFLHGIDLGRTFVDSDIDICSFKPTGKEFKDSRNRYSETGLASSTDRDEVTYKSEIAEDGIENRIKIEYKYDKTQNFKVVEYKGVTYRVTLPQMILGWKVLFACRGSKKNRADLDKLGVRYIKRGACPILCPFGEKFPTWEKLEGSLEKRGLSGKNLLITQL